MVERTQRGWALGGIVMCLGLIAPAATARAQAVEPERMASAQSLYDEAIAEMDSKRYASACPKLEEVTRRVPEGLGGKLTLAECYELSGKLASAWSQYTLVEEAATKAGQADRKRKAAKKVAELRPRLAMLTIDVPDQVRRIAGIAIAQDGAQLGEAQWSTPLPVDAGEHEIVATAPGRTASAQRIDVAADGVRVSLVVKPLEMEAPSAPARPASAQAATPRATRREAASARPWQRPLGLVTMGLGAVGVGAGVVLGGLAAAKKGDSNANDHCYPNNRCDATGLSLRDDARSLGSASTVVLLAGSAVLAGGVALFLTAPQPAPEKAGAGEPRARWSAVIAPAPGGVLVKGAW
jgi:hypothetical protein